MSESVHFLTHVAVEPTLQSCTREALLTWAEQLADHKPHAVARADDSRKWTLGGASITNRDLGVFLVGFSAGMRRAEREAGSA